MTTYEEWRVVGTVDGKPYEFTWSPQLNPHLGDPEQAARRFIERFAEVGIEFDDADLRMTRRTVTVTDWEPA